MYYADGSTGADFFGLITSCDTCHELQVVGSNPIFEVNVYEYDQQYFDF